MDTDRHGIGRVLVDAGDVVIKELPPGPDQIAEALPAGNGIGSAAQGFAQEAWVGPIYAARFGNAVRVAGRCDSDKSLVGASPERVPEIVAHARKASGVCLNAC